MSKTTTWMPLYIADYLSDTIHLTAAQHGAYLLILMEIWRKGPIPDDKRRLARIAKVSCDDWDAGIWPVLSEFLTITPAGVTQKRLEAERSRAESVSKKRAAATAAREEKKRAREASNDDQTIIKPGSNDDHKTSNGPSNGDQTSIKIGSNDHQSPITVQSVDTRLMTQSQLQSQSQLYTPSLRSGGAAPPAADGQSELVATPKANAAPIDARKALFTIGLQVVRRLVGKSEAQSRTLIGQWLKSCGDDCALLNTVLLDAADLMPAAPVAWIKGAIAHRTASDFRQLETKWGLDDVDLDAALRDHERALGL